jgi:hypothetical protein
MATAGRLPQGILWFDSKATRNTPDPIGGYTIILVMASLFSFDFTKPYRNSRIQDFDRIDP